MSRAIVIVEPRGGSKDDSGQLQAALDYLAGTAEESTLYLAAGEFYLTSTLTIPNASKINIEGAGKSATVLNYHGATASEGLINFTGAGNVRHYFHDFTLYNHDNELDYCLYGEFVHHSSFERVRTIGGAVAGVMVQGWVNTWTDCEIGYSLGPGLWLKDGGNINGCTVLACKFYQNNFGIRFSACLQLGIRGCAFENSAQGAILGNSSRGVTIDNCYFESNGGTAYELTGVASETVDIYADVILLGNTNDADALNYTFPVRAFKIFGNMHSTALTSAVAYYVGAGWGGSIESCYASYDDKPLVRTYWDSTYSRIYNLSISNCHWEGGDSYPVLDFLPLPSYPSPTYSYPTMEGVTLQGNSDGTRRCRVDLLRNYRDLSNLTDYPVVVSGTATTVAASAEKFHDETAYTFSPYGTHLFAHTIDMTQYRGRLFRLSLAYKKNDAPVNGNIRLYIDTIGVNVNGYRADTTGWVYTSMVFRVDSAWTNVEFGFGVIGAPTDLHISHLQLTEIGIPLEIQAW